MKGMLHKFSLLALLAALLLAGCEKDGKNGWLYSEGKDFQPVTNLTGEAGYGYALLRWELPAKADQLTMIDVSWVNTDNEMEYKKLTRFDDSLWLDLEMKDYTFRVASCGVSGDVFTDSIALKVPDWRTEPIEIIQNVNISVIENGIYLRWDANNGRAFSKTTFKVYDVNNTLVDSVVRLKSESSSVSLSDLEYNTDYVLNYYSENVAGMATDVVTYNFKTDRKAPNLPTVEVDEGRRGVDGNGIAIQGVYAYSADIKWTEPEAGIDSLRITFTGLNDQPCDFRFLASDRIGHLSLLPGGAVTVAVSAYIDGEWSASAGQTIRAKEPTDKYQFRLKNSPAGGSDQQSKIGQAWIAQTDLTGWAGSGTTKYTYEELYKAIVAKGNLFQIRLKPRFLDEIELCPTLETLQVGFDGNDPGVNQMPALEEFINLVKHLPNLKVIKIRPQYSGKAILLDEFTKSKYPNLKVQDLDGKDIQKD